MERFDLEVDQQALGTTRTLAADEPELEPGQIECRIRSAALTANNVTYAAVGHQIGYWKFFPARDEGWGRVPIWGFADVTRSNNDEIAVGERIYGYWPMSSHLVMTPAKVTPASFMDGTEHRRALPPVYNQYVRCQADPLYRPEDEDYQSIFRPLFITSFMIDDFLEDNDWFGGPQVLLSSASSKTAFGTAFLLAQRTEIPCVGLTSAGNRAFVEGLGCYDQVVTYDELESLDVKPSVYVDIAGNSALRARIHERFGDALKFSSAVGYSHLGTLEAGQGESLPGPRPEFFFAPAQIQKREKDWRESGGVAAHYARAWQAFLPKAREWVTIEPHEDVEAARKTYEAMVAGQVDPKAGHILHW